MLGRTPQRPPDTPQVVVVVGGAAVVVVEGGGDVVVVVVGAHVVVVAGAVVVVVVVVPPPPPPPPPLVVEVVVGAAVVVVVVGAVVVGGAVVVVVVGGAVVVVVELVDVVGSQLGATGTVPVASSSRVAARSPMLPPVSSRSSLERSWNQLRPPTEVPITRAITIAYPVSEAPRCLCFCRLSHNMSVYRPC